MQLRMATYPFNKKLWLYAHVAASLNFPPAPSSRPKQPTTMDVSARRRSFYMSKWAWNLQRHREGIEWFENLKSSTLLQNIKGDLEWARQNVPAFDTIHSRGKLNYGTPNLSPGAVTKVDVDEVVEHCSKPNTAKEELYQQLASDAQFGAEDGGEAVEKGAEALMDDQ
ncbi:hypothetical protein PAXINDRAFT_20169 [Paxillus involutus ATCC 200175]|uniref:Uncharacterized protein n=1 Tax=Paxillus involutus ATCC 200175 TaxID=664439 RepID=A0A0C9TH91_PAXIN|nr:hypothetical protein PAXINDRAFT_20169 [Paxillus involutus ATCC 200175]